MSASGQHNAEPRVTPARVAPLTATMWIVSVNYDPGLNLIKRLFHRPDPHAFAELRDRVWQAIRSSNAITVLESQA
jgi:hypothetical protein